MKCFHGFSVALGTPQHFSSALLLSDLLHFCWHFSAFTAENGFGAPEFCHCYHISHLVSERAKDLGNCLNLLSFEIVKTNWTHFWRSKGKNLLSIQRNSYTSCTVACIVSEVKTGDLAIFWPSNLKLIFWSWTQCQQVLTFLLLTELSSPCVTFSLLLNYFVFAK